MSSYSEIEEIFFRQMHPLLASKQMKLFGRVAKGFLRATLRVDLDGDGSSEGSVSAVAPDIDLQKYLNGFEDKFLVFDDLERCAIPLENILGYINSFVEHEGCKAIILVNEKDIEKKPNEWRTYLDRKEKVIGQTLLVEPDIACALSEFVNKMQCPATKNLCETHIGLIEALFAQSTLHNLRSLRRSLELFERVFSSVQSREIVANGEACIALLKTLIPLSIEYYSNKIEREHFEHRQYIPYGSPPPSEGERSIRFEMYEVGEKYPDGDLSDQIIPNELMTPLIVDGHFDVEMTREALLESKYFSSAVQRPFWEILWWAVFLEEEEVESAIATTFDTLENAIPLKPGEILHITGCLLRLSALNLIDESRNAVLEKVMAYLEQIANNGGLTPHAKFSTYGLRLDGYGSYGGHSYMEITSDELRTVFDRMKELRIEAYTALLPARSDEVLDLLRSKKIDDVEMLICGDWLNDGAYSRDAVFAHMDAEQFLKHLVVLPPQAQLKMMKCMDQRYSNSRSEELVKDEQKFLSELKTEIGQYKKAKNKFQSARLDWLLDRVVLPNIQ